MRLRMEWWKYVLLGVSLIPFVYACYLYWQAPNNGKHVMMSPKEYQQQRCARWLLPDDQVMEANGVSLIREYYHCFFSLTNNTPCYKRFHEEAVSCLKQGHNTMSEEQIRERITGGIMEAKCQDVKKACVTPQSEDIPEIDRKKISNYLESWCQNRLVQECTDSGYAVN